MRKHIPNILTLLNLFSGCIAITMAFKGNFMAVFAWGAIAALFDFFDGKAARLLDAYSPLGKELDSLADVVSFGVAPASALFVLLRDFFPLGSGMLVDTCLPYVAFLMPLFSAYRLAKFNIDERQARSFIGLPTPANALFWISYCYGLHDITPHNEAFTSQAAIIVTILLLLLFSWLMVSEIPMFSMKNETRQLKGNWRQILLILLTILFIALWGIAGISLGIVAYIMLSVINRKNERLIVK